MDSAVQPPGGRGSTRSLLLLDQRASPLRDTLIPHSSCMSPHRIQSPLLVSFPSKQLWHIARSSPTLLMCPPLCNPSSKGERASKDDDNWAPSPTQKRWRFFQQALQFVLPTQADPGLIEPKVESLSLQYLMKSDWYWRVRLSCPLFYCFS